MKNKAANALVAIIIGVWLLMVEVVVEKTPPYLSIGITIYGLWLATKVLNEKENNKKINRIIAIITLVIGCPLILLAFIYSFS